MKVASDGDLSKMLEVALVAGFEKEWGLVVAELRALRKLAEAAEDYASAMIDANEHSACKSERGECRSLKLLAALKEAGYDE